MKSLAKKIIKSRMTCFFSDDVEDIVIIRNDYDTNFEINLGHFIEWKLSNLLWEYVLDDDGIDIVSYKN